MNKPLADYLRPKTFDEVVGQTHLVGDNGVFKKFEKNGFLPSVILQGPPGSGKTTIARLLGKVVDREFVEISGVSFNTAYFRKIIEKGDIVLFIDEIHHLNKIQQDTLLPHIENGRIILIGSTTENPSFSLIRPLLSRVIIYKLNPLEKEDLKVLAQRSFEILDRSLSDEIVDYLSDISGGDARVFLNYLEILLNQDDIKTVEECSEFLQEFLHYDRKGDEHYNIISAYIKSMRGSDVDAALYYLARMLESGEDPLFILRRLLIFASEDIGNADTNALNVAVSALHAFQSVGFPEGEYFLYHATIYLSLCPKSDSVKKSMFAAKSVVKDYPYEPVPFHLRNPVTSLMRKDGYGDGYVNPHNSKYHVVKQEYMPENIKDITIYVPVDIGTDKELKKRYEIFRKVLKGKDE